MGPQRGDGFVRFGVFELDLRQHELRRQGRRVHLQDKPFDLLALLVSRPGSLVTRDELQHHLWPGDTFVVFADNLNAAVRKAREALGDSADAPRYIETVPRHGYRFIAPVESIPRVPTAEPSLTPVAGAAPLAPPPPLTSHVDARPAPAPGLISRRPAGTRAGAVLIALAAMAAVVLGLGWSIIEPSIRGTEAPPLASRDVIRYRLTAPPGRRIPPGGPRLAVSPDGQQVAFVAHVEPAVGRQVWIQSVESPTPRAVHGSEEAFDVFWSPDSRSIAFIAVGMLRTLHLESGAMVALGPADDSSGGAWSQESGLLVTSQENAGLVLYPPGGGSPVPVTTPDPARDERVHRFPQYLADGRHFIYSAQSRRPELSAVYLARVGEPGRTWLLDSPAKAEFVEPDILLYVRDDRLVAQRLDLAGKAMVGVPQEEVSGVFVSTTGEAWFSSSSSGVFAYAGAPPPEPYDLTWLAADGRRLGTLPIAATCVDIAFSPDDRQVALGCREVQYGPPDVWVADIASGTTTRLTTHPANDGGPVWSPDGKTIVYARARAIRSEGDMYALDPASPGVTRPVLAADGASEHPTSWSPDGEYVLFEQEGNIGKQDLWLWPTRAGGVARPWLATPHSEHRAVISPDGRWVAYQSDRTGRPEVYARELAAPEKGEWALSTRGGRAPKWWRDGNGVFFISEDWQMTLAVPGPSGGWNDGVTRVLFEMPGRTQPPRTPSTFDVTRDGQRFLIGPAQLVGGDPPLTVVVNWRPRR